MRAQLTVVWSPSLRSLQGAVHVIESESQAVVMARTTGAIPMADGHLPLSYRVRVLVCLGVW